MRLHPFKVGGRILSGFVMCYGLLVVRDYLSLDQGGHTELNIFQHLMKDRISRIEQHCKDRDVRPNIKTGEQLYVLQEQKLIWCPVFKAASTNWMYNLLPLAGLDQQAINFIRFISSVSYLLLSISYNF